MNILVVGNGGREHALCWKLAQSKKIDKLYCAPGNAGTSQVAENININVDELEKLADFAIEKSVAITVAGPEAPLCAGIVNTFKERGLKVFGPDKFAAQLEGSKCFAKNFMIRNNIPTAKSHTFNNRNAAIDFILNDLQETQATVIKADGLAAGKGVLICQDRQEAIAAVEECFQGTFGEAGYKILIEEFLEGEEVSVLALTDGKTIKPLLPSQDHKRVGEGDTGLNTGGMGAYCPTPIADSDLMQQVQNEILDNFLNGVQEENMDYHGIIYAGLMITASGPKVLEFNVRFGDPEVQTVLSMLDTDLLEIIEKVIDEDLKSINLEWKNGAAVCIVMASEGYPGSYKKGFEISGLEEAENAGSVVFHAGTSIKNSKIVNSGGRVLGVTAVDSDLESALKKAYTSVRKINWPGAFYRNDIAHKAIKGNN